MTAAVRYKRTCAILILFLVLLSLLLSGCAADKTTGGAAAVKAEKAVKTISVVDFAGRDVRVPQNVKRIGCLYAFSGHVVAMLGKEKNIVAVVAGLKRDKLLTRMYPSIKNAYVPYSEGSVNIEELMNANPDIVFVQSQTANSKGEVEKLKISHTPYLVVDYRNMKEQQNTIAMIGKATGAQDKAKKYNAYYQHCIDLVRKRVQNIPWQQRVRVYHSVNEATRTDTRNSLSADWIQTAGAIDVSVNGKLKLFENKYYAGLEQIYLWDPEVILCNEEGVANYILTNQKWAGLKAVKNHEVYQMPNGISRWGHPGSMETPLAILWTAKTLYPDRFKDIDMREETKKFYKEFFNYPLNDAMVDRILSGEGMRIEKTRVVNP